MQPSIVSRRKLRDRKCLGVTVIELMVATTLAVLVLIAFLLLFVSTDMGRPSRRSTAAAEIQAMSAALEGFKTDHGFYAPATNLLTNYLGNDVTQNGGNYQISSQLLYRALSGQTNFTDQPTSETKAYMIFKRNMVGEAAGGSFVKDPSGNPFGYSTGSGTSYPFNGYGYFDLWSTAGTTGISAANTNAWISNWQ